MPEVDYLVRERDINKWFNNLDKVVLDSLRFLQNVKIPQVDFTDKGRVLVCGSGNAFLTGKILFHDGGAVVANESDYEEKLKIPVNKAYIISSSGGKNAPQIAKACKDKRLEVSLLTCNPNAPAIEFSDRYYIFPSMSEPYTYNTSTYLSMVLSKTHEDPKSIHDHITTNVNPSLKQFNLSDYNKFYILVPDKFENVKEMFRIKFIELFGEQFGVNLHTPSFALNHATDIVPATRELAISFGYDNKQFGSNRLNVPLSENPDYGELIAVGYSVIGRIQSKHPSYFRDNIVEWCKRRGIDPLVQGNEELFK